MATDSTPAMTIDRRLGPQILPKDSDSKSHDSGFIKIIILFDDADASEDVISASADMGATKDEGEPTAKLEVVLNNHNNQYARRLFPHITTVMSWIVVQRNVVHGPSLRVETTTYPFFFGIVNEVNLNHDTVTVQCGDEASKGETCGSADLTWFAGATVEERVNDILSVAGSEIRLSVIKQTNLPEVKPPAYAPTSQSTNQNITDTTKLAYFNWSVPADQIGRLLVIDKDYTVSDGRDEDVTAFMVDPGDCESVVGHCNVIEAIADSPFPQESTAYAIPASDSSKTYVLKFNEKTIIDHGVLNAPSYRVPQLTAESLDRYVNNLKSIYEDYDDRLVTPEIVSRIPLLFSNINFSVWFYDIPQVRLGGSRTSIGHDRVSYSDYDQLSTLWKRYQLLLSVRRKKVSYDGANGVITQMECRKREEKMASGGNPVDEKFQLAAKKVEGLLGATMGEKNWTAMAYDPETGQVLVMDGLTEDEARDYVTTRRTPRDSIYESWYKDYTGYTPWGYAIGGRIVDRNELPSDWSTYILPKK